MIPQYLIETKEIGNYATALASAVDAVLRRDPKEIAQCAHVVYNESMKAFEFQSLGFDITVSLPDCRVCFSETGQTPILEWRLVMLHNLGLSDGAALSDELAHFRQMPGGNAYETAFVKRSSGILTALVCSMPSDQIVKACGVLGGTLQNGAADIQAEFWMMPRFPMTVQIWTPGDDSEPYAGGTANVLFNERASHYLPTEDMAVAASLIARFMAKQIAFQQK